MFKPRPFRLQFASNLFVHRGAPDYKTLLKPVAPTLALLGNIGNAGSNANYEATRDFLLFCTTNWRTTIWVPGHEELSSPKPYLWSDIWTETKALAEEVTQNGEGGEIIFADCVATHAQGVRLLGMTGWNPVPKRLDTPGQDPIWQWDKGWMTKEQPGRPFKVIDSQNLFAEENEWLEVEFKADTKTPSVLLTSALPNPLLLGSGLPDAAYKLCDLTTFYPSSFLKPKGLMACLGGATGSVASGTWNGRYYAVNSYRACRDAPPNPNYNPEAVYEIAASGSGWPGGLGGIKPTSTFLPKFPLPSPVTLPNAVAICQ